MVRNPLRLTTPWTHADPTVRSLNVALLALVLLVATVASATANQIIIRTGQVAGAPGDPAVGGFDDCFRVLEGPCAAELSTSAFTAADFSAASSSTVFAQVVAPVGPWIPTLTADPLARWIHSRRNGLGYGAPARNVLYACRFERPAGCTTADITIDWAVDNRLGDFPGGSNPIGVYLNGTALSPSFAGGEFTAEYSASLTGYPLVPGTNWLYVYQRDTSCGYAGLILSARISCANATGDIFGTKYSDDNCNGVQDAGESGLPGWEITASGDSDYTTTTDASGNYEFLGLPTGIYTVSETTVPGWIVTEPSTGSYTVTLGCDPITGLDFGNCRCVGSPVPDTPPCLAGWYPMDEGAGTTTADLAAGNTGTLIGTPVWMAAGYIGGSIWFPSPLDYVEAATGPDPDFDTESFAVSGWLRINDSTSPTVRTLLDKRVAGRGFWVYLDDGMLSLEIRTPGGTSNYVATGGTYLNDGIWHHFAVVACRNPIAPNDPTSNRVTLYVDGVPDAPPTTGLAVQQGVVTNNAPLRFSRESDGFPTDWPLHGELDDVMLFDCCLSDDDVLELSGGDDFATTTVAVPSFITVSGTTVTIPIEICNYLGTPQDYTWTIAGLPAGGTCTIDGPSSFTPVAGTLSLPPGPACDIVFVEAVVPPGLITGEAACYEVTVQNVTSGECFSARGSLLPSGLVGVADPDDPVVSVPTGVGVPVSLSLTNTTVNPILLDYELRSWSRGHDGASPVMSLDGHPAGSPIFGNVLLDPGVPTPIAVSVTMESFEPFNVNEVRLVADLQGLGLPIESQSVIIKCEHSYVTTGVPGTADGSGTGSGDTIAGTALQIDIAPNPFANETTFQFSLDQRDQVGIEVFDAAGRLVRGLQSRDLAAGPHTIQWDGRDDAGQRVNSGVYWVRVIAGGRVGVEKLLTLR